MEKSRFNKGRIAENAAAEFLTRSGIKILDRNFRCPSGEIDIIGREGNAIVFVEVRSTGAGGFGLPEESIIARKRRRIVKAAQWYIKKCGIENLRARIDVIAIRWNGEQPEINWIVNAFEARS